MALHAGEVSFDEHGVTAASVNLTFRLLDAPPLKAALTGSPGVLALIASAWFFDEVVQHAVAADPATYRRVAVTVKETATVAWIALPDCPYPPSETEPSSPPTGPAVPVPRQLPASTAHFVGRADELKELTGLLDQGAAGTGTGATAGTVVISAIGGTAGIGKTALALHWAHRVADRFPDGQLYVNLRGFDPAGSPVQPAAAIRGFLDAFEVDPGRIPVSLEAQVALYRSLIASRRVLVVLDNARDADQVRPLLPGSETCMVTVTSRSQLSGLVAQRGARPLTLGLLTVAEARELLARSLGPDRVTRESAAVDELIGLCAKLPLALSVVAARAATQPGFPLAVLADELRDARRRLDALDAGDLTTNVRAVFSWSYQYLDASAARMFRLLSLHPGPDISLPAAASLAGIPPRQARAALAALTRAHLVTEYVPGRFAFHDLLRTYAAEQTGAMHSDAECRDAIRRVLDHYLHTAYAGARLLDPHRDPISLAPPRPGTAPEDLASYAQALAWFGTEHRVLLAAVAQAADTGFDAHAWQLPWTLADFFNRRGHWHDWVATQNVALAATRRLGDLEGEAAARRSLGRACIRIGACADADTHLRHAVDLYGRLGDPVGQAHAHRGLSMVHDEQARHAEALSHAQQALGLFRAAGHRVGQADALNAMGWKNIQLGDPRQALSCCQQALELYQNLGQRDGEAATQDSLGYAHHHLGNHRQAIGCYQQALNLFRELGDRYYEAVILTHLGDTRLATGDTEAARGAWRQALAIVDDLHHPDADQVRAKLRHLDQPAGEAPAPG
jgi:tetratricopeptide (TPR) repeat protein